MILQRRLTGFFVLSAALLLLTAQPCFAQEDPAADLSGFYSAGQSEPPQTTAPQGNAMGNNAPTAAHSFVVTTMDKCYDQLSPAEAQQIKEHSLQPYADCRYKLQEKKQAQQHYSAAEEAAALTPVTPRNFIRVQTGPDNSALGASPYTAPADPGFHGGYWHRDKSKAGAK